MAQISTTLYKNLAESFHNSRVQMLGADDYLQDAVDYVVDVTTAVDGGVDIELALLGPVNLASTTTTDIINSTGNLMTSIRAINDYVITNTSAANSAAATSLGVDKLEYWVNVTMKSIWAGGCVPEQWYALSTDAGYDTTGWKECVS